MNTSTGPQQRVLLTTGDPTGIGPEVAAGAAAAATREGLSVPLLVGPPGPLAVPARRLGLRVRETDGTVTPEPGFLDVVPVTVTGALVPGQPGPASGVATVESVRTALELVERGVGRAIVAAPHSEAAVAAAGIDFAGYPGLLADLLGVPRDQVFLMLVGGGLRIVHVTLHERLADALDHLTPELVTAAGRAAADTTARLGVDTPRIGVFGINPHAGENGLFGRDDDRVTAPAVQALRAEGIAVDGPTGADLLLGDRSHDAFVAMYHDQGHIPVKLLAGRTASALSIGAGVTFSSVGHGAAFDIAGRGTADPQATLRAVRLVGGLAPAGSAVAP